MAVLGDVRVQCDGVPIDLGTRKQRSLLAALTLCHGRAVATDTLIDMVWGTSAPPGAVGTLQAYIAGLRRVLEPDRGPREAPKILLTVEPGYALHLPPEAFDATRFEALITTARHALGRLPHTLLHAGQPTEGGTAPTQARQLLDGALELWRGTPYLELADAPAAQAERARLSELRLAAMELQITARLAEGDHAAAPGDLEALTAKHPLRERLWGLRALALVRAGRQGDALAALRQVRSILADELGVDPSRELVALEAAILRQDPAVQWRPAAEAPVAPAVPRIPAEASASETPASESGQGPSAAHRWPLVGRAGPLEELTALLTEAEAGTPSFASVVGEPGIGKSRLCAELAMVAERSGCRVLIGRCSQDDGAPPLWPWSAVLQGIPGAPATYEELAHLTAEPDQHGERFRTWDAISQKVFEAAADRTVLVVLDDLHWSDTSSLRVLRHLVSTAEAARLLLVCTWRRHPEPTGALAEVAEALGRRHALRVELQGLDDGAAGELLAAVAGTEPTPDDAAALRRRTDGNPFFLVEYARLLTTSSEAGAAAALDSEPPAAVADVLARRLAEQPAAARQVLRAAAVLGHEVRLDRIAALTGQDEDAVLDTLDAPLAAGLVTEDGVDRFRFAHALVRDAVYGTLPLSRRARLHAKAAAAWESAPQSTETLAESARHWLAAGPAHAAKAWTAAIAAADAARKLHAHEEVRQLLCDALNAQREDPASSWTDRYAVLMSLADTCGLLADWDGLSEAVDEAVAVAEAGGDIDRAALAAVAPSQGALWQPRARDVVHQPVVDALRRALHALPPGDGERRCQVMVALAAELYYASAPLEREALAEQALAMARRLGSANLLQQVLEQAFIATWRPATTLARLALIEEALERARQRSEERSIATAATLHAVVLGELGRISEMWTAVRSARELAVRLRMAYLLIVLDALEAPWLALAGEFEAADEALRRLTTLIEGAALPHAQDGLTGAYIIVRTFQQRGGELADTMQDFSRQSQLPLAAPLVALLQRVGRPQEARTYAAAHPIDLERDDWFALLTWCCAGEAALGLGDSELGAAAYRRAAPYAGRPCIAGSGAAMGPVDAFLALAAAAAGELPTATAHADRALQLCAEWRIPVAAQWLRDHRERSGF